MAFRSEQGQGWAGPLSAMAEKCSCIFCTPAIHGGRIAAIRALQGRTRGRVLTIPIPGPARDAECNRSRAGTLPQ